MGLLSDISNTTIIADLESKLPNGVRQDWIKIDSTKEASNKTPNEISNLMLSFFEETRLQAEYPNTDVRNNAVYERAAIKLGFVCGIQAVSLDSIIAEKCEPARKEERLCLACADGTTDLKVAMHPTGNCAVCRSLSLKEKKLKVNCIKCPFGGKVTKHTTTECKKTKFNYHNCLQENDYHTCF